MAGLEIFSDMAGVGPIPPAISWFCFPLRELNPQAGVRGLTTAAHVAPGTSHWEQEHPLHPATYRGQHAATGWGW